MDCPNFDSMLTTPPDDDGECCAECGDSQTQLFRNGDGGNEPLCWNCVAESDDVGELVLAQDARTSRPVNVTVDLATLGSDIAASIRCVLESHGLVLVRAGDTQYPYDRSEAVLRECGNNVAGVIALAESEAA